MTQFGANYGATAFVVLAAIVMMVFGMILEGAPAMIMFGPLLTPIASQLGVNPLQFGTVMVIAMGLGLFAPPVGTRAVRDVRHHGHRGEERGEADDEISHRSGAGPAGADLRPRVLAVAAAQARHLMTRVEARNVMAPASCALCPPRNPAAENRYEIASLSISTLYLYGDQRFRGYSVLAFDARHAVALAELSKRRVHALHG